MGVSTDAVLVYGYNLDENVLSDETIERIEHDRTIDGKLKSLGIEIVDHCSDEETLYILGVSSSEKRAWRGYPLSFEELDDFHHMDGDLREGLEILGVDPIDLSTPRWWLASWWS